MRSRISLLLLFALSFACNPEREPDTREILVVAHRGDWRNAPENSLAGIQNSIEMGVDMVELDLGLTKDSVLILMHDKTLDRTTTGSGKVNEWPWDSLQVLSLKDHKGNPTPHQIPTFREAMGLAKGHIDVFVDKGYQYLPQAYDILLETNTLEQAHFLGFVSATQFKMDYPELSRRINYMPLVLPSDTTTAFINDFEGIQTPFYLFSFDKADPGFLSNIDQIDEGSIAMATTQVAYYSGGYTDSVSLKNPDNGWGWIIDQGFKAICTDHPHELLEYLRANNLHD